MDRCWRAFNKDNDDDEGGGSLVGRTSPPLEESLTMRWGRLHGSGVVPVGSTVGTLVPSWSGGGSFSLSVVAAAMHMVGDRRVVSCSCCCCCCCCDGSGIPLGVSCVHLRFFAIGIGIGVGVGMGERFAVVPMTDQDDDCGVTRTRDVKGR